MKEALGRASTPTEPLRILRNVWIRALNLNREMEMRQALKKKIYLDYQIENRVRTRDGRRWETAATAKGGNSHCCPPSLGPVSVPVPEEVWS